MKDISIESFVSNLLFIGIECEMKGDGVWAKGKE
jgi:hypothetical protein